MAIPYMNPYYAQLYGAYTDISNGPIPLPPDSTAYSIGPASDQTTLTTRWSSFRYGTAVNQTRGTLIKDENDFFYYIVVYWSSGAGAALVRINVYDAENDIDTVYEVTTPAQFAIYGTASALNSISWVIRKSSANALDFVCRGTDSGSGDYVYQHYTWTIGDAALAYAGGGSYDPTTYGYSIGYTLMGNRIVDMTVDSPKVYITTYDLDSLAFATTEIFDLTGKSLGNFGFFHAGDVMYAVVLYGEVTATGECPEFFGGTRTVNEAAELIFEGTGYRANGTESSIYEILDEVTGHDCAITLAAFSGFDHCSMNPASGRVYIRLVWVRSWSSTECDVYFPGTPGVPEFEETRRKYFHFDLSEIQVYAEVHNDSYGRSNPVMGPTRYVFPSRSDPLSLITSANDLNHSPTVDDPYIFHWVTQTQSASNIFVPIEESGVEGNLTVGCGQRNDNGSILISVRDQEAELPFSYHNVWKDTNGNTVIDQDAGYISNDDLPVHGFMGKWPVHHRNGGWMIFGPNTPQLAGPRWQVV